jgi:hypothetical protein
VGAPAGADGTDVDEVAAFVESGVRDDASYVVVPESGDRPRRIDASTNALAQLVRMKSRTAPGR